MSAWSEKAEAIKERLESLVALQGVPVFFDRQKDWQTTVNTHCAKELGACISILWNGGLLDADPCKRQSSSPDFLVNVFTLPIAREGCLFADDLVEAATTGIHGHLPAPGSHCNDEFRVVGPIALIDHPKYLIYAFPVTCRATHPEVQVQPDPQP